MSAENDSIFSIDIHTHIIPENMPDFIYGFWRYIEMDICFIPKPKTAYYEEYNQD